MEDEQDYKRREYETWDEAFRGLTPAVRQQSVRVAAYTQALFVQACIGSFGKDTRSGAERMRGEYADLSYKCGMYCQLGKALVPPEYQIWQADFTQEEQAVYRKYTADGRALVASLQEKGSRAKEKRRGTPSELPTKNIPWLMLRESCEQHMERWDGSGYPAHLAGNDISPIAQIVGLAKELDRLASGTRSETPFEDACRTLTAQSGTAWSPALIEVLQQAKAKCFAVYNKYIHYTMTLPSTVPLVVKHEDRPMGLKYRPMVSETEGTVIAYEAVPWFGGIADRPGETEGAEEIEEMLRRNDMIGEVSFYLLYEAADALLRAENCRLGLRFILVRMMPQFYALDSQLQQFVQLFKDQPVPREKLLLTIPAQTVSSADKAHEEIIKRYLRNGVALVADGYDPAVLPSEKLAELGFAYLRLPSELYLRPDTEREIQRLKGEGFTVLGGGADSYDALSWLCEHGVLCSSGTMTGLPVSEDELIRDGLARETK